MFLPTLSKSSLEKFRALVSVKEYKKGDVIVSEGQIPYTILYFKNWGC